jgi:hypothetical protein
MTQAPSTLLPWTRLRVWVEDPALRATRELSHRRAIVVLACWKAGEASVETTVVDVTDAQRVRGPDDVDWRGFPPAADEPSNA